MVFLDESLRDPGTTGKNMGSQPGRFDPFVQSARLFRDVPRVERYNGEDGKTAVLAGKCQGKAKMPAGDGESGWETDVPC
jgi:hypothetical protein